MLYIQNISAQMYPLSDPTNSGNWVLNTEISDEFDVGPLDETKWQIQGKNDDYKSGFIGRAPSQFSPDNAIVENKKLKIRTKWEPDFEFSSIPQDGVAYENITTAAVISKQQFQYGYMEINCKAAKAEVTSSFWTTGQNTSEMDMFEMFGDPKGGVDEASLAWKKRLKFNMISWDPTNYYYLPDGNGPAHTRNIQADNNTADAFHVYGFEWTSEYIRVYIDGVLSSTILKSVLTDNGNDPDRWVTDVPYWIWFDSETFPWLGIPDANDLSTPVDYEIEYIRVWETNTAPVTPTTLTTGDIGIVGWKAEGTNNGAVAFKLLKDISLGTSISISNRSWKDDGSFNTTSGGTPFAVDDVFSWTATSSHSKGTILKLNSNGVVTTVINGVQTVVGTTVQHFGTDNDWDLSITGDSVLIYNGATATHPVSNSVAWITGLTTNGAWGTGSGNTHCELPSALTNGTNAVSVGLDQDNGVYKGKLLGSESSLRATINNSTNWITSEDINYNLWSHLESVGANSGDIGTSGTLGISDYQQENPILVYPNPVDKSLTRYITIKSHLSKKVILYDITGKLLITLDKTSETIQLPISNLASGIYLVSIISEFDVETKKIIIK